MKQNRACEKQVRRSELQPMSRNSPGDKNTYDLTDALRILRHAGREDPQLYAQNTDEQVQKVIDALCDLSVHDGMTGLVNATFFHVVLAREIERCLRTGKNCGLMVLDIDYFKRINDTYGHGVGDRVIQSFAANIMQSSRRMDTAARIGGEEFAVILPECTPTDAIQAARRIHTGLNPLEITVDLHNIRLTSSAGLVWTFPGNTISSGDFLAEADREMYRAKHSGRERLCHPPLETTMITQQERTNLMALPIEETDYGE